MEPLAFFTMGKKDKFIRIRSDDELKDALRKAGERCDRKEADQARWILRRVLGLTAAEDESVYEITPKADKRQHKKGSANS